MPTPAVGPLPRCPLVRLVRLHSVLYCLQSRLLGCCQVRRTGSVCASDERPCAQLGRESSPRPGGPRQAWVSQRNDSVGRSTLQAQLRDIIAAHAWEDVASTALLAAFPRGASARACPARNSARPVIGQQRFERGAGDCSGLRGKAQRAAYRPDRLKRRTDRSGASPRRASGCWREQSDTCAGPPAADRRPGMTTPSTGDPTVESSCQCPSRAKTARCGHAQGVSRLAHCSLAARVRERRNKVRRKDFAATEASKRAWLVLVFACSPQTRSSRTLARLVTRAGVQTVCRREALTWLCACQRGNLRAPALDASQLRGARRRGSARGGSSAAPIP